MTSVVERLWSLSKNKSDGGKGNGNLKGIKERAFYSTNRGRLNG